MSSSLTGHALVGYRLRFLSSGTNDHTDLFKVLGG
jgi:hypothetical protein